MNIANNFGGSKMKTTAIVYAILALVFVVPYVWNFVKLTSCDFNVPLKCEVIHAVGLVPPLQVITVWFDTDEEK